MLKILRYVLSVVTILFATYGLITKNFEFNHILIFLLGLTMLIMGLEEFRKERKANGWLFVVVFLFSLFVSIQGFLLS
ncbi:YczI family protein [Bacillus sp. 03113]|uniref:YczI family protein n=1 Tax=Bacillus sp. 03113 TaxID=2578211 RepID=UPI0011444D10|nr:YczI family protein [Bacillus sp. 03113]